MASDQTILANLTSTIKARLPIWYGGDSKLRSEYPERRDRPFTVFLNYTVESADHREFRLILKLPRDHWMHSLQEILDSEHIRNFARQEAEILQRMETAVQNSGNPSLGAIHTLAYLPDFCAVVMEHTDFTTFKRKYLGTPQILMSNTTLQAAEHDAALAGTWLKLYHDTFAQKEQIPTGQLPILDSVHQRLLKIEKYSGSSLQDIRIQFEKAHAAIREVPHPISILHNDFHFNNVILIPKGKVGGFDPNPEPPGSIYVDVARILTDCTIRRQQVFSRGLFYGNTFNQRIRTSFLEGYQTPLNEQVLNYFSAATVLEKWGDDEEDLQTSRLKAIYPLLFRGYYKREIKTYLG